MTDNVKRKWYEPADPTPREQCPCCDYFSLPERENYLICPVCFWEDEGQDLDRLDEYSDPNHMTLREGRRNFKKLGAKATKSIPNVCSIKEKGNYKLVSREIPIKEVLYSSEEIDLLKEVLTLSPKAIIYDFNRIILDFGDYHLEFFCTVLPAATQNKSDEAIVTSVKKIDGPYQMAKDQKILENLGKIKETYVARTLLYFSNEKPISLFTKFKRITKKFIYKFILNKKLPARDMLLTGTISHYLECVTHPKSKEAEKVDPEYSNLLDVGVLLVTEHGSIPIFVHNNGYGYNLIQRKNFYTVEELLKFIGDSYEFVKI